MPLRIDSAPITQATKLENGWLRAPARLSRSGIFEYRLQSGGLRREFRPPEEVFHKDSLDSFELVPLVDDHPSVGKLTAENTAAFTVGSVGKVRQDGEFVGAEVLIQDKRAVEKVEAGKQELSCGYTCDTIETPGIWNGQKYDAVQRNIRANHVALVAIGRAGPEVKLRLDSPDAGVLVFSAEQKEPSMNRFVIDGVEVEIPALAAQLITKERATAAQMLDAVKGERDAATKRAETAVARADASDAKVKDLQTKLDAATNPTAVAAAVAARVALEKEATERLGIEVKLDGLSDDAIRRLVILKSDKDAKLDGKSADYLQARYDAAVAQPVENTTTTEADRVIRAAPKTERTDTAPPERALANAISNAWQPKQ